VLFRSDLIFELLWKDYFTKILYRPFDIRDIYYQENIVFRTRREVMRHMLEENIAVIMPKRVETKIPWRHCLCGEGIIDHVTVSMKTVDYVFPLYLYSARKDKKKNPLIQMMMFEPEIKYQTKQPNIKLELFEELNKAFNSPLLNKKRGGGEVKVTPEEIFYYIYAVLYSNTYRIKYAEFLKIDFPRVPFTKDYRLFIHLSKLGHQLAELHLLKSKELEKTISKFPIDGSNKVEKPRFDSAQRGKVWINKEQYFDGVKEEVWQYQIGGYQVCEKWLKDRKERTLTLEEIKTYCKIVTALSKTIELQNEIDKYFEEVEKTV